MSPARCIVLPGLDGTGELLHEFVAAMAPRLATSVVAYPRDRRLGYDDLVDFVRPQLPADQPYLLLGESFSGPVAIRLAAQQPPGLSGLVLCATFARAPRPPWSPLDARALSPLAAVLPPHRIPTAVAATFMLGRWATPQWRERLRSVLRGIDPAVLRRRLREVASVDADAALRKVQAPCLYLQAGEDRLVSAASRRGIQRIAPQTHCIEIPAPHFLLQACPDEAARAIGQWLDSSG